MTPKEGDADMTDLLMSSISLEEEDFLVDLDVDADDDNKIILDDATQRRSSSCPNIYESLLFDPTRQQFEWREEVSLFKQLKVTRLSTIWEK